jgi:hypothetical protein
MKEDSTTSERGSKASESSSGNSNPPWFPSLLAFEHYDCARTHLFPDAKFGGALTGPNKVRADSSPAQYPTPYNVVYLDPNNIFVYGGGYGDVRGGSGAFVAKVVPDDPLETVWYNKLIDTVVTNEWNYPGVLSILNDGLLYVIYGYRLAKINPQDGSVIGKPLELPTLAAQRDTSYNGLDALPDGTLIAKTVYRQAGCEEQGFSAFLHCPHSDFVPNSLVVAIDPQEMKVVGAVVAPEFIGGRLTTTVFDQNCIYLAGTSTAYRYLYEDNQFTLDKQWNPGSIYEDQQTGASAMVVMNDWVVMQTNSAPAPVPLSVVAINQNDARVIRTDPFENEHRPPYYGLDYPQSVAPASVSADPNNNRIYALDAGVGKVCALELRDDKLEMLWMHHQPTTEFLALIGPSDQRVVVGTEIPRDQLPASNKQDFVVWRDAATGNELARTLAPLPAISTGTMVEPSYDGQMYYLAQNGQIIKLTVEPE